MEIIYDTVDPLNKSYGSTVIVMYLILVFVLVLDAVIEKVK